MIDVDDPAAIATDAARPQPFLHVVMKVHAMAKLARDQEREAAKADRDYDTARTRASLHAFLDSLSEHRWHQLLAFFWWGTFALNGNAPDHDVASYARQFTQRLGRDRLFGDMWYNAPYHPDKAEPDAHRSLYWAHRLGLDIERAFPLPRGTELTG